jgi:hypothetical protein
VGQDVLEIGVEGVDELPAADRRWLASSSI